MGNQRDVTAPAAPEREPGPERPVFAPADPVRAVIALQRTIGNQAVGALLRRGGGSLARAPQPAPAAAPAEAPFPDPEFEGLDKQGIQDETKAEILLAFPVFCDACDANVAAMKAAAKAKAEMASLAIDIAAGFLAPAFAGAVGGTFLGRMTQKVAQKMVVPQPDEKVKELIGSADLLKASFSGATKVVGANLKSKSTQLFGEGPDEAFLDAMKTEFQRNAAVLVGQVHKMPRAELFAVWGAYDASFANINTYKASIKELLDQFHAIESIGDSPGMGGPGSSPILMTEVSLYRVIVGGKARLVVLKDVSTPFAGSHNFVSWIPTHLETMALVRERAEHGGEPPDLALEDISGDVPDPPP
jgi:hypothetical protein